MTDISKCFGEKVRLGELIVCPHRETCYRYMAPENPDRQSYIAFPQDPEDCGVYWQMYADPKP